MADAWSVERIRAVDRIATEHFGMSSLILMENAGRGAADWIIANASSPDRVLILCGVGNNGGDGLVIARHLHAQGSRVRVWMFGVPERMSPDARTNWAILSKTRVPCAWWVAPAGGASEVGWEQAIHDSDLVIDALLGTGGTGSPRGAMAAAIEAANGARVHRLAIDIPTGLDARDGTPYRPTFRADTTLTFVASKTGFGAERASEYVGHVVVLPIGVPPEVLEQAIAENP